MSNRQRGIIAMEAGGTSYRLQFTTNAMCALEDATDQSVNQVINQLSDRKAPPRVSLIRKTLWALLTEHHPEIGLGAAGKLCDDVGLPSVTALIGEAVQAAFPEPETTAGKTKASKAE